MDQWRPDRMKLSVRGDTLRAWLNGKELFADGVKDADLKDGAAGLYAEDHYCSKFFRAK